MSQNLLTLNELSISFGGLKAVSDLTFSIHKGSLVGLIGPNGAGKTTVFNMLTGVYLPSSGVLEFAGFSLAGLKPYEISKLGIARTFQNIRLFKNLTVLENVLLGFHKSISYGISATLFETKNFEKEEKSVREQALGLLEIFQLGSKANEKAGSLPYGEQRKLEIVRALATKPELILLDEPAAGMNHSETHNLMELIAQIRDQFHLTVLLIEHDMKLVMGICEHIVVLDHGTKIAEGSAQEIQNSKKVIEAYLGVDAT